MNICQVLYNVFFPVLLILLFFFL